MRIPSTQFARWALTGSGDIYNLNPENVSVGTATPTGDFKFEVKGSIGPVDDALYDLGSPTKRFRSLSVGTNSLHVIGTSGEITTARDWKIGIRTTGGTGQGNLSVSEGATSTVDVTPAGDVGIGTSDPQTKLHVVGQITASLPTSAAHVATKGYVDTLVEGLDWQDPVKSKVIATPPLSPTLGDRYIVGDAPTDAWVGHAEQITEWKTTGWDYQTPTEGWATWVEDEDTLNVYNSSYPSGSWIKFGATITHSNLLDLSADDHTQYFLANGTRDLGGSITPALDVSYSLGTSGRRFQKLYVGPGSLHIRSAASETGFAREYQWSIQQAVGDARGNLGILNIGGDELLTITPDGMVGFGATVPQDNLHILAPTADPYAAIRFDRATDTGYSQIRGGLTEGLSFWTYATTPQNRLQILPGGQVGIGVASPTEKLEVAGNAILSSGRLYLGDKTDSTPMLKASGSSVQLRAGDDSGYVYLSAAQLFSYIGGVLKGTFGNSGNPDWWLANTGKYAWGPNAAVGSIDTALIRSTAAVVGLTNGSSGAARLQFGALSIIGSPADGNVLMTNSGATGFGLLQFGGTSASFSAFKGTGTTLAARTADDSLNADLTAKTIGLETVGGTIPAVRWAEYAGSGFGLTSPGWPALYQNSIELVSVRDGTGSRNIWNTNGRNYEFQISGGLRLLLNDQGVFVYNKLQFGVAVGGGNSTILYAPSNGNLRLSNAGGTDFGLLQFGGISASYPALKRNGTALDVRLADDSGYTTINVGGIVPSGSIIPSADITYDLGENTTPKRWRSVYAGPASFHVASTAAETTTARDYKLLIDTVTNPGYFRLAEGSNTILSVNPTNQNVGIGTLDPVQKLHVAGGSLRVNGDIYVDASGSVMMITSGRQLINLQGTIRAGTGLGLSLQTNASSTDRLFITTDGKVGINTTTPGDPLHVVGHALFASTADATHIAAGGHSIQLQGPTPTFLFLNTSAAADNKVWTGFEVNATQLFGRVLNDALSSAQNWITVTRSGASVSSVVFPNGNVGVGTIPAVGTGQKLEIAGGITLARNQGFYHPNAAVGGYFQFLLLNPVAGNLSAVTLTSQSDVSIYSATGAQLFLRSGGAGNAGLQFDANNQILTQTSGAAYVPFTVQGKSGQTANLMEWRKYISSNPYYQVVTVVNPSGYVGIGDTAPAVPLSVMFLTGAGPQTVATFGHQNSGGVGAIGDGPLVAFKAETATEGTIETVAAIGGVWEAATAGASKGAVTLYYRPTGGVLTEGARLDGTGKFGIGLTDAAQYRLDVNGSILMRGSQDLRCSGELGLIAASGRNIILYPSGVERVRFMSTGKVGINNSNPDGDLQVNCLSASGIGLIVKAAATPTVGLQEWRDSSDAVLSKLSHVNGGTFDVIGSGTGLYLRISGNAGSGIPGIWASGGKFQIASTVGGDGGSSTPLTVQATASGTIIQQWLNYSATQVMRLQSDGQVKIGAGAPGAMLDVAGNVIASDPTLSTHLATKAYVDGKIQGLDWQESVIDQTHTAPPVPPPTIGDRYIIASPATGLWTGMEEKIAEWTGVWTFSTPDKGTAVYVEAEGLEYLYNDAYPTGSWVQFGGTIHHGALVGLGDDDHTQYLLVNGNRALTGSLKVLPGTAGAPSITTVADATTGINMESTGYVNLVSGGVVKGMVSSVGLLATGYLGWNGSSIWDAPSDGKARLQNWAAGSGFLLDGTTDGTLQLFARNGTTPGALNSGALQVYPNVNTTTSAKIRGDNNQTNNILEIQRNNATLLSYFAPAGNLVLKAGADASIPGGTSGIGCDGSNNLNLRSSAAVSLYPTSEVRVYGNAMSVAIGGTAFDLMMNNASLTTFTMRNQSSGGATKLAVKSGGTQGTSSLQEWQNSSGVALSQITYDGRLRLGSGTTVYDAADGVLLVTNQAGTAGVQFDCSTDGMLQLRTRAGLNQAGLSTQVANITSYAQVSDIRRYGPQATDISGGATTDAASNVAVNLRSYRSFLTAGAKLVSFQNNTTEMAFVDKDGRFAAPQFYTPGATADAVPNSLLVKAGDAYAPAAINKTGANLILGAGLGSKSFQIVSNLLGNTTVTATVNGTSVPLTSGTHFVLGVDDTAPQLAVSATNLAAAINGNGTLSAQVTATANAAYVYLTPKVTCGSLIITTNQYLRINTSVNTDGSVLIGNPGGTNLGIAFVNAPTSGMSSIGPSYLFVGAGSYGMNVQGSFVDLYCSTGLRTSGQWYLANKGQLWHNGTDGSFRLTNSGGTSGFSLDATTDGEAKLYARDGTTPATLRSGHHIPLTDLTYDLGENTTPKRWRSAYVGPTSLHVSSTAAETATARDYQIGIITASGATQGHFQIKEGSTEIFRITPTGGVVMAGTVAASSVDLSRLGSSTYRTVQDACTLQQSTGELTGGVISDLGGGSVQVTAGTGLIRATNNPLTALQFFDWPTASFAIPSNTVRYLGVTYNAGTPQVESHVAEDWDYRTSFPIGSVVNESGTLHIEHASFEISEAIGKTIQRFYQTNTIARDNNTGGLILGETGTRNITMTTGALWKLLDRNVIPAINTSGTDRFESYYRDGSGGWVQTANVSQWDNVNYDNNVGTLTALTAGQYGNLWFYIELDGNLVCVYGRINATSSAAAEAEAAPSTLPTRLSTHGILIGRLTFQKTAATATTISTVFTTTFANSSVAVHANLSGLSADDHPQYLLASGARQLSAAWNVGLQDVRNVKRLTIGSNPTPLSDLHIEKSDATQPELLMVRNAAEAQNQGGIWRVMGSNSGTPTIVDYGKIQIVKELAGNTNNTSIQFYVRDGSGTVAERVRISSNGFLGIGGNSPADLLHIVSNATASYAGQIIERAYTGATAPAGITFEKANGTIPSKTAVTTGDKILGIVSKGWDGSAYITGADYTTEAESVASGKVSQAHVWRSQPTAGGSIAEIMRLTADGKLGIGASPSAFKLQVAGSVGPNADLGGDLGSSLLRFGSLYLGPTSLHIVSTAGETTTARDYKLAIETTAGGTQGYLKLSEGANLVASFSPGGNFAPVGTITMAGNKQIAADPGTVSAPGLAFTGALTTGLYYGSSAISTAIGGVQLSSLSASGLTLANSGVFASTVGSATAAGYSFVGSLGTGLFLPGSGILGLTASGVEAMRINTAQQILIGTNTVSNAALLTVNGTISSSDPSASTHVATKKYVDDRLQGLDWQESVLNKTTTTPPGSPTVGERYIIAAGATGVWAGLDGKIAEWTTGGWVYTTPDIGTCTFVEATSQQYLYAGANWPSGAWSLFSSTADHGLLTGLGDDDHTQYLLVNGNRGMTGNLNPSTDLGANLGTGLLRWGSLNVGPSSLKIVSTSGETTTARSYSWGIETTAGSEQGHARFKEGSSNLITVTPGGNVGIAATNPGGKLEVGGLANLFNIAAGNGYAEFKVNGGSSVSVAIAPAFASYVPLKITGKVSQTADLFQIHDSGANPFVVVDSGGNLGLARTTPAEKLDVNGGIRIGNSTNTNLGTVRWDGTNFQGYKATGWTNLDSQGAMPNGSVGLIQFYGTSTAFASDAALAWDNTNKWLGIGKTPSVMLDVAGQARFTSSSFPVVDDERTSTDTASLYAISRLTHQTTLDMVDGYGAGLLFGIKDSANVTNNIGLVGAARYGADNTGRLVFHTYSAGVAEEKMTILPDGKVGIGTSTPAAMLQIRKDTNAVIGYSVYNADTGASALAYGAVANIGAGGGGFTFYGLSANYTASGYAGVVQGSRGIIEASSATSNGLWLGTFHTSAPIVFYTANAEKMRILPDGKVGIGTLIPAGKLEVVNLTGGGNPWNYLQVTGSIADNLNYPGMTFKGGTYPTTYPSITMSNGGLTFWIAGGYSATYSNQIRSGYGSNAPGQAYFDVSILNGSTTTELIYVKDNGNVGIGNITAPASKLSVKGGAAFGASYATAYAAGDGQVFIESCLSVGSYSTSYPLSVEGGANQPVYLNRSAEGIHIGGNSAGNARWSVGTDNSPSNMFQVKTYNGLHLLLMPSSGKVGIGSSAFTPSAELHVYGSTNGSVVTRTENANTGSSAFSRHKVLSDTAAIALDAFSSTYSATTLAGEALADAIGMYDADQNASKMIVGTYGAAPLHLITNNTKRLTIAADGKVGIGTSVITTTLHVDAGAGGVARFATIDAPNTSGTHVEVINQRNDGNTTFGGRIGLSHWRSDGTSTASDAYLGAVYFGGPHGGSTSYVNANNLYSAAIVGVTAESRTSASNLGTSLVFLTTPNATGSLGRTLTEVNSMPGIERMRIAADGKVGIGVVPQALLDIKGPGALTNIAPVLVAGKSSAILDSPINSVVYNSEIDFSIGNTGRLLFMSHRRVGGGADWDSAGMRIQAAVDNSFTGYNSGRSYIEFAELIPGGTGPSAAILLGTANGYDTMAIRNGRVGIGTINPIMPLEVYGSTVDDASSRSQVRITSNALPSASPVAGLSFGIWYTSGGATAYGCSIQGYKWNTTDGDYGQALRFTTQAHGASPATSMTIDPNGLVSIKNMVLSGQIYQNSITTNTPVGTTQTINFDLGNVATLSLGSATGNVTVSFSNPKVGASYIIKIAQVAAGTARNVIWPANVLWQGGTDPVITTAYSALDVITLVYDGTNYYGNFGQNYL